MYAYICIYRFYCFCSLCVFIHTHTQRERDRNLLRGIGSRACGGREVMICHLHAGESRGVMQSESEGWRSSRADGVSPRPWAGEDEGRCPTSTSEGKKRRGGEFLLPLPFVLFRLSMDWIMPTHIGEGIRLY